MVNTSGGDVPSRNLSDESREAKLSIAWEQLYEGLPAYNVVKIAEGFQTLHSYVYECINRKDVKELKYIANNLRDHLGKMKPQVGAGETEILSHEILSNELQAFSKIVETLYEKLQKENPYSNPTLSKFNFKGAIDMYTRTKDESLLKAFDEIIADIFLKADVSLAEELRSTMSRARIGSDEYLGLLSAYETHLSHFLLFMARTSSFR